MSTSEPLIKKQKFTYKNQYGKIKKRHFLEVGQRGFLATCNFREKDCVRECYNILNQYADELYGEEPKVANAAANDTPQNADDGLDISDVLQKQVDAVNEQCKSKGKDALQRRFQAVDTGANNCIFVTTTLADPVELGQTIVRDIAETRKQKSRFLLRLVPIEAVCKANIPDILAAAGILFDKYFLKNPCSFSIIYNKRYNNDIARDDIIGELAKLVTSKNVANRVDLKQPDKSIIVEIIKGLSCLSVVEGYFLYKKYNLIELAQVKANSNNNGNARQETAGKSTEEPAESNVKLSSIVNEEEKAQPEAVDELADGNHKDEPVQDELDKNNLNK